MVAGMALRRFSNSDGLQGCVLAVRPYGAALALWNRDARSTKQISKVKRKLRAVYALPKIKYQVHRDTLSLHQGVRTRDSSAQTSRSSTASSRSSTASSRSSRSSRSSDGESPFFSPRARHSPAQGRSAKKPQGHGQPKTAIPGTSPRGTRRK